MHTHIPGDGSEHTLLVKWSYTGRNLALWIEKVCERDTVCVWETPCVCVRHRVCVRHPHDHLRLSLKFNNLTHITSSLVGVPFILVSNLTLRWHNHNCRLSLPHWHHCSPLGTLQWVMWLTLTAFPLKPVLQFYLTEARGILLMSLFLSASSCFW